MIYPSEQPHRPGIESNGEKSFQPQKPMRDPRAKRGPEVDQKISDPTGKNLRKLIQAAAQEEVFLTANRKFSSHDQHEIEQHIHRAIDGNEHALDDLYREFEFVFDPKKGFRRIRH